MKKVFAIVLSIIILSCSKESVKKCIEILDGPFLDKDFCSGQSGLILVEVSFDGELSFNYNNFSVDNNVTKLDESLFQIFIDNPVEIAFLEIYNSVDCNVSKKIDLTDENFGCITKI